MASFRTNTMMSRRPATAVKAHTRSRAAITASRAWRERRRAAPVQGASPPRGNSARGGCAATTRSLAVTSVDREIPDLGGQRLAFVGQHPVDELLRVARRLDACVEEQVARHR